MLTPGEYALWTRLVAHDQVHAVRVAKATRSKLVSSAYKDDGRWLGAALMHDIGKLEARLAMHERVAATLAGRAVRLSTARRWASGSRGVIRRFGLYLTHGAVGAAMIRRAAGREELAAWAEVHQALPSSCRIAGSGPGCAGSVRGRRGLDIDDPPLVWSIEIEERVKDREEKTHPTTTRTRWVTPSSARGICCEVSGSAAPSSST